MKELIDLGLITPKGKVKISKEDKLNNNQLSFINNYFNSNNLEHEYLSIKDKINLIKLNLPIHELKCPILNCNKPKALKFTNLKLTCNEHNTKENINSIKKNNNIKKYGVDNPAKLKEIQNKKKNNNIEKYGVDNPAKLKEIQNKKKNNSIKKYGVTHPSKLKETQEKKRNTNIKKYGVPVSSKSNIVKDKVKKNNIKKYGVTHPSKLPENKERIKNIIFNKYGTWYQRLPEIQNKVKKTWLKNYGVDHPWKNKQIQEKIKKTNLAKYGHPVYLASLEGKEKVKKTWLKNYGVDHPWKNKQIQEKIKFNNIKKYGHPVYLASLEGKEKARKSNLIKYKAPFYTLSNYFKRKKLITFFEKSNNFNLNDLTLEEIESKVRRNIIDNFIDNNNNFLIKDFQQEFDCSLSWAYVMLKKLNISFTKLKGTSLLEKEVISYIRDISKIDISNGDISILANQRNIIKPLELDIYIPERNLAIEFNGLYWHSYNKFNNSNPNKDKSFFKNKHLIKTEASEAKNINLLHIFENEWLDPIKQDIWKSMISYKIGIVHNKYYARKLVLKELNSKNKEDKKLIKDFFNNNHLQGGNSPATVALGLFTKNSSGEPDELVSLMTFGKSRYSKNHDYELIRFASKKYSSCAGCAQKLLKYFMNNYMEKNEKLISYANRRWANSYSNVYKSLGFKYLRTAEPNYFYFKLKDTILYSRVQFQKHKLKDKEDTKEFFDKNLNEMDIVNKAGYRAIWDSGNLVYELIKE